MKVTIRLLRAIWIGAIERQASLLGESLKESVEPASRRGSTPAIARVLKKFGRPERRIAVYDAFGSLMTMAPSSEAAPSSLPEVTDAMTRSTAVQGLRDIDNAKTYIYTTPLESQDRTVGALAVFLDASHLDHAEMGLWQYNAVRFIALAVVLSTITVLIVRASISRPLSEIVGWAKALKTGKPLPPPDGADAEVFGPLAIEVAGLAKSLYRAQALAEKEAELRLTGEAIWTEARLKQFVRFRFDGHALFIVSNRQPVSHAWKGQEIVLQTPASGVMTAMEPVMRACGGVWVAHGSGDADQITADATGRIRLPADHPLYTLRRVWLSKDEEEGYYYGFANEGRWPLCHVVHARPTFRPEDWTQYRVVNTTFAEALLEEMAESTAPLVLVQDYHFALLPALIKAERPDARVAIFWHIPWPTFEAFGICPWQDEILRGMLASDLIGFHTQYRCNNFLQTVERTLEARIDAEHFAVVRGEHHTSVQPFPISVAADFVDSAPPITRDKLLDELGVDAEFLGVGVERVKRYQLLQAEVRATIDEVNRTLRTRNGEPIVYIERHLDRQDIWPFYRHANFCLVSSLHDGMNLVAKDLVSVRNDENGPVCSSASWLAPASALPVPGSGPSDSGNHRY